MAKKISPIIGILKFSTREDASRIYLKASCVIRLQGSSEPVDTGRISIDAGSRTDIADIRFRDRYGRKLPNGYSLNEMELSFSKSEAENFDIQNRLIVNYDGRYFGRILYSLFDLKKGRNKNSTIYIYNGMAMYFRQNRNNSLTFTVRDANQYDYPEGQERLKKAYRAAMAARKQRIGTGVKGRDRSEEPILMYEKNCSRYEESASVLYEKLIDAGYSNVWYVVNEDNPAIAELPEKYRRNLVWKDSDRHLKLFFECDKFISSETIDHALQIRIASKLVQDKLTSRDLMYVFLQHGVMYMVSLNSEMRIGFRQKNCRLHKTVVSSELEAQHFIQLAGMKREDLYITGLAKFDKCYRNESADRIIIMPTWRRWETNQARDSLEETGYYRMILRMFNAVPPQLREKVVILPHPLMKDRFRDSETIGGHIMLADSYDLVLRDCDLLITDYSSIAYDAFYRGANVIFCWEEKDECMRHYGEETYLMLNEDNVFGDVCMSAEDLTAAVEKNYCRPQNEDYVRRYRRIVEFNDGNNSGRIMECLKKDKVLQ